MIKYCPECGSMWLMTTFFDGIFFRHWIVCCQDCGHTSEPSVTRRGAWRKWNNEAKRRTNKKEKLHSKERKK